MKIIAKDLQFHNFCGNCNFRWVLCAFGMLPAKINKEIKWTYQQGQKCTGNPAVLEHLREGRGGRQEGAGRRRGAEWDCKKRLLLSCPGRLLLNSGWRWGAGWVLCVCLCMCLSLPLPSQVCACRVLASQALPCKLGWEPVGKMSHGL